MVEQDSSIVNGIEKDINPSEEIMIPYPRVLYIAWDRDVGQRLQELRNAKGISQGELAKRTNGEVKRRTIISLEGGESNAVSRKKLDAILAGLDSDVRSLFPTTTVKNFQIAP